MAPAEPARRTGPHVRVNGLSHPPAGADRPGRLGTPGRARAQRDRGQCAPHFARAPGAAIPTRPAARPAAGRWACRDGIMGNSEVGHMNLGAGRIVHQDITRIDLSIERRGVRRATAVLVGAHGARPHGRTSACTWSGLVSRRRRARLRQATCSGAAATWPRDAGMLDPRTRSCVHAITRRPGHPAALRPTSYLAQARGKPWPRPASGAWFQRGRALLGHGPRQALGAGRRARPTTSSSPAPSERADSGGRGPRAVLRRGHRATSSWSPPSSAIRRAAGASSRRRRGSCASTTARTACGRSARPWLRRRLRRLRAPGAAPCSRTSVTFTQYRADFPFPLAYPPTDLTDLFPEHRQPRTACARRASPRPRSTPT